jgi:hypothetical protein
METITTTEDRSFLRFEPYTSFTERTTSVQWILSQYRNEVQGVACPVSAGWPELLAPIIPESNNIIGFDLNEAQIEWYRANYPDNLSVPCFLGDISNPSIEMKEALSVSNFLFVSNIPDWLAGITGRADRASSEVHEVRIQRFIGAMSEYLSSAKETNAPRFLLVSSVSAGFLKELCFSIQNSVYNNGDCDINVRIPSFPFTYRDNRLYPINNYAVIEVYP